MSKPATAPSRFNGLLVPPDQLVIVDDPKHHLYDERSKLPVDENLVRNIMVYGVKVAVHAKKDGDKLLVVAGRQRVKAAIEANIRLTKEGKEPVAVPVVLERGDEGDQFGVMILENELRQGDSPMLKAKKAARLVALGKSEYDVAITFGVSGQTIKNWLKLLEACAAVRKAVDEGKLGATAAVRLASLDAKEQEEALAEMLEAGEGGRGSTKRAEAKVAAKKGKKSNANRPSPAKIEKFRDILDTVRSDTPKDHPAMGDMNLVLSVLGWILDGQSCKFVEEVFKADDVTKATAPKGKE